MVGTIRRPLPEINAAAGESAAPPPSYNYATSPTVATTNAGAFQRQQGNSAGAGAAPRPYSTASASSGHARPLSQASIPSRPGSYAAPPGAPPGHTQQSAGPPPPAGGPSAASIPSGSDNLRPSNTQEDRMAILRRYDTCILIDDSASMHDLWREAEAALAGIVEQVINYDADGLDVHFLNSTHSLIGAKESGSIRELFQYVGPVGESTPTEIRVEELLSPYMDQCERAKSQGQSLPKPLNLLVLTDGEADDPDTLAYSLQGFAKRLDDIRAPLTQLGVQFVQIGNDPSASQALKELDDELQGCRDMVDTTPYQGKLTSDFLVKVALGSINRRIDRSG